MKLLTFLVLAILLLQVFADGASVNDAADSLDHEDESDDVFAAEKHNHSGKINCHDACSMRCMKASRKKICHRACKSCCKKCHCVPPGTYGNKEACPCYASLRTHGNRLKCP